ncbi:MAG TPA: hypothetical protein VF984_06390 [Actinomycetota bacterium]
MSPDRFDVLERFEPLVQPPEPSLERFLRRRDRKRRNQRLSAAAVGIAVFVVVVWILTNGGPFHHARIPAGRGPAIPSGPTGGAPIESVPFFLDLRSGAQIPLAGNLAGGLNYAASPDGTRLAYESNRSGGCSGSDVMTVANTDGTDARTLESPKGLTICAARWSPDGTKLVYQERDGTSPDDVGSLFVHDLSSGDRTQLTDLPLSRAGWWFIPASFTPDGRSVIFHLAQDSSQNTKFDVWSVPATGGEPTMVLRNAAFPIPFPDGKRIAFLSPMNPDLTGRSIQIADATGSRRTLVEANGSIWWPTMSPDGSRIAYQDGGSIYVVDVSTGEASVVAEGGTAEWFDDETLIVAPGTG